MNELIPPAEKIGAALKQRKETIAVAESSAGGLISGALLAVPGASAYFLGGSVVYTRQARAALLNIPADELRDIRPSTEAYAKLLARTARAQLDASWALAETGATGPTGNRYGDAAGHACVAVVGPPQPGSVAVASLTSVKQLERAITIETGSEDRVANMRAFAKAGLELLAENLSI